MSDYILGILMRTDIPTFNMGKRIAHGAHAADACKAYFHNNPFFSYMVWEDQTTQGFGTTLCFSATEELIDNIISIKETLEDKFCKSIFIEKVLDPTYPDFLPGASDAEKKFVPMETCAYMFAPKEVFSELMTQGILFLHE